MASDESLFAALGLGVTADLRGLLTSGAVDPNVLVFGVPVLIWAASRGRTEICAVLIENGTNVQVRNNDGRTALMMAALGGHTDTCSLLLEKQVDMQSQDNDGKTALMFATSWGDLETFSLLLEAGADPTLRDNDGKTTMDYACDEERLKNVLQKVVKRSTLFRRCLWYLQQNGKAYDGAVVKGVLPGIFLNIFFQHTQWGESDARNLECA